MSQVTVIDITDSFVARLADFIETHYIQPGRDLSRLALVFGGQRPRLFLQKELAGRLKRAFLPPRYFTADEFVGEILAQKEAVAPLGDMDACYLIYQLARTHAPEILESRASFAQFLPWAREILAFIEQLDLQDIAPDALRSIQTQADIGYEVPANINALLTRIVELRRAFHEALDKEKRCTRGYMYARAAAAAEDARFPEFDEIAFCNFFYLHKTEIRLMKALARAGHARFFFQGSPADWPVLESSARELGIVLDAPESQSTCPELFLHAGFDRHSQIAALRDVLKAAKDPEDTLIVLPDPAAVMPLLSEVASCVAEFNVSMGYPAARTSVYSLLESVFEAQATRKGPRYYTKDYLKILSHPLVKNLAFEGSDPSLTRVLAHKIEEAFLGMEDAAVRGSLFVSLKDVTGDQAIFESAAQTARHMDLSGRPDALKKICEKLHAVFFESWESVGDARGFADRLESLLDFLLAASALEKYPFHLKVLETMYEVASQFKRAAFGDEAFGAEDLFKIFRDKLENETVAFSGSPLKGVQILGVLETRALNFGHVLVLDANESSLPKLKIREPLIPRDVMISLGLDRLEKEEEIQRYQFLRLIASAKRVDLFYAESEEHHRSRFVEDLVWEREKRARALGVVPVRRPQFRVNVCAGETMIAKTPWHIGALERMRFSASSLDTYLRCPLRFFYQYVLGLKEKEDMLGEPEASDIGNFIHGFLEDAFKRFLGRRPCLDEKFETAFFKDLEERFDREFGRKMASDAFLVKEVLRVRLRQFLEAERQRPVASLLGVERVYEEELSLGGRRIRFKAKVDRLDRLDDGSLLIVDYKTGTTDVMPRSYTSLERVAPSRLVFKNIVKSFQLPLYYRVASLSEKGPLNAGLCYLRHADRDSGFKTLFGADEPIDARQKAVDAYLEACGFIVNEIFDPAVPFEPDMEDSAVCGHCPFFYLCR